MVAVGMVLNLIKCGKWRKGDKDEPWNMNDKEVIDAINRVEYKKKWLWRIKENGITIWIGWIKIISFNISLIGWHNT